MVFGVTDLCCIVVFLVLLFNMLCLFGVVGDVGVVECVVVGVVGVHAVVGGGTAGTFWCGWHCRWRCTHSVVFLYNGSSIRNAYNQQQCQR